MSNTVKERTYPIDWKYWAEFPILPIWAAAALACNINPKKIIKYSDFDQTHILYFTLLTLEENKRLQRALSISIANINSFRLAYSIEKAAGLVFYRIYMSGYINFVRKSNWENCPKDFFNLKHVTKKYTPKKRIKIHTLSRSTAKALAKKRHKPTDDLKDQVLNAYKTRNWVDSKNFKRSHSDPWKNKADAARILVKFFPSMAEKTIKNWLYALNTAKA